MKIILIVFIGVLLAGGLATSCKHYGTNPPDSVKCDTCHTPCDTCNVTIDTSSHAFEWTEYTISSQSNLSGVVVYGPNSIYAFHDKLYIFDGTGWNETAVTINGKSYLPTFTDMYVFGLNDGEYWAASGNIVYHGKQNKVDEYRLDNIGIMNYPIDGAIRSCWGSSSTDMFFVGDTGTIFHYDGTAWTKFSKPTTKNLQSVWGTNHNDVWACGFNSSTAETILLHYDGNSWSEDPISATKGIYATGGFNGVWACDSGEHKFVTTSGALLIRKTDNNPWRSDSGLVPNSLGGGNWVGIAPQGNTASDFFVTGGWGFVAHWNGKTWHKYTELYDYNNPHYGPGGFSVKGNTACVVGVKSGQSWVAIGRRK